MRAVRRGVLSLVFLLGATGPASAQQDVDFDIVLRALDLLLEAAAVNNGTPLGQVLFPGISPVTGLPVDHDANGIPDLDQFALLGAVLRGNYTCGGEPAGTVLLDQPAMQAIRDGFAANRNRIRTDMGLSFLTCLGAGLSPGCNLLDILSETPEGAELASLLQSILAAYMTLGEPGFINYNGGSQDFAELFFDNLLDVFAKGTDLEAVVPVLKNDINFNPNNYQKFGGAAGSVANRLGAAGNIDFNLNAQTNGAAYTAAGGDRDAWLALCNIDPPLRVAAHPAPSSVEKDSGDAHTFTLTLAGGCGDAEVQWQRSGSGSPTEIVRPYDPNPAYTIAYLIPADGGLNYLALARDEAFNRTALPVALTVNLVPFEITGQPQGGGYTEGDEIVLSVVVRGGAAVPVYQWRFSDGGAFADIGDDSDTLRVAQATPSDSGLYHCVVWGDDGMEKAAVELVSDDAEVLVLPADEGEFCEPQCTGRSCGDDTCGGSCGFCPNGFECDGTGQCVPEAEGEGEVCEPQCAGLSCGDDGCGGACGFCPAGFVCDGTGQCIAESEGEGEVCAPQCAGLACGDDGCGGACGFCPNGFVCDGTGQCIAESEGEGEGEVCEPQCAGLSCGDDGCGGACGFCPEGFVCDGTGQCTAESEGEGVNEGEGEGQSEGEGGGEPEGGSEGEGDGGGEGPIRHSADQNGDGLVNLSELLRVIQFYNSLRFGCDAQGEDGYAPNSADEACAPHASDYNPQDWRINLSELLRLIQFYNSGGYAPCETGEDGFCPAV